MGLRDGSGREALRWMDMVWVDMYTGVSFSNGICVLYRR
jgi:hypothetical protein